MKISASLALVALTVVVAADTLAESSTANPGVTRQPLGCLIQPERVAEVGSPVVGVIESMLVERGDTVRKGQAIAILQNGVDRASLTVANRRAKAEADVKAARANLMFARQSLDRAQLLHARNFISSQALDQGKAETEVARQKLAQAEEQQRIWSDEVGVAKARLEDRTIRSPFDGVIAERYLSDGERVEVQPLVRVAKVDPLRVEVIMPGSLYGSVAAGSVAQVTPDMAGAAAINAKVTLVDRILDAASGTFRVRLSLPNPGAGIPAGLRCKVDFSAGAKADAPAANKSSTGSAPDIRPSGKKVADKNLKAISLNTGFAVKNRSGDRTGASKVPVRLKLDSKLSTPDQDGALTRDEI